MISVRFLIVLFIGYYLLATLVASVVIGLLIYDKLYWRKLRKEFERAELEHIENQEIVDPICL